jgi:hypothetical protein
VLSCVGRGLCDGLITRPEESYSVSVCVWSRNPEKGGQKPILDYKRLWMNEGAYWFIKMERHKNKDKVKQDGNGSSCNSGRILSWKSFSLVLLKELWVVLHNLSLAVTPAYGDTLMQGNPVNASLWLAVILQNLPLRHFSFRCFLCFRFVSLSVTSFSSPLESRQCQGSANGRDEPDGSSPPSGLSPHIWLQRLLFTKVFGS